MRETITVKGKVIGVDRLFSMNVFPDEPRTPPTAYILVETGSSPKLTRRSSESEPRPRRERRRVTCLQELNVKGNPDHRHFWQDTLPALKGQIVKVTGEVDEVASRNRPRWPVVRAETLEILSG